MFQNYTRNPNPCQKNSIQNSKQCVWENFFPVVCTSSKHKCTQLPKDSQCVLLSWAVGQRRVVHCSPLLCLVVCTKGQAINRSGLFAVVWASDSAPHREHTNGSNKTPAPLPADAARKPSIRSHLSASGCLIWSNLCLYICTSLCLTMLLKMKNDGGKSWLY